MVKTELRMDTMIHISSNITHSEEARAVHGSRFLEGIGSLVVRSSCQSCQRCSNTTNAATFFAFSQIRDAGAMGF